MNPTLKRYLISSVITFLGGFAIAVAPFIDKLTMESLTDGALVGLIFIGVRAGIKVLVEAGIAAYNIWQSTKE